MRNALYKHETCDSQCLKFIKTTKLRFLYIFQTGNFNLLKSILTSEIGKVIISFDWEGNGLFVWHKLIVIQLSISETWGPTRQLKNAITNFFSYSVREAFMIYRNDSGSLTTTLISEAAKSSEEVNQLNTRRSKVLHSHFR